MLNERGMVSLGPINYQTNKYKQICNDCRGCLVEMKNRCSNLGENYIWGGVKVRVKIVDMGSWQNGVYMFSF